jgi:hypothetical protein
MSQAMAMVLTQMRLYVASRSDSYSAVLHGKQCPHVYRRSHNHFTCSRTLKIVAQVVCIPCIDDDLMPIPAAWAFLLQSNVHKCAQTPATHW